MDKKERTRFDNDLARLPARLRKRQGPPTSGSSSHGTRELMTLMGIVNKSGGRVAKGKPD
jgi:hypothetical protein